MCKQKKGSFMYESAIIVPDITSVPAVNANDLYLTHDTVTEGENLSLQMWYSTLNEKLHTWQSRICAWKHSRCFLTLKNECVEMHVFLIWLPTYPCWINSFSFATFLSSITVKDKTQSCLDTVSQEQLSPVTGRVRRLITSLMYQSTVAADKHRRTKQLWIHVSKAFTYTLQLFCGARRSRWGRTVLGRISSALWSTLRRKEGS